MRPKLWQCPFCRVWLPAGFRPVHRHLSQCPVRMGKKRR